MGLKIIRSRERGETKTSWLLSKHSFSFGSFYSPQRNGFGVLRVINEDWVAPGAGFPTHPHADFEIITIVLEGELEHKDSMGNKGIIKAGEVQRMSAGSGVKHSEVNPSKKETVHSFQIWIEPKEGGIKPSYEQKSFSWGKNEVKTLVSYKKGENTAYMHQDAKISIGNVEAGKVVEYEVEAQGIYLHLIDGELLLEEEVLYPGDALEGKENKSLTLKANKDSQFLIFQVPLRGR